MCRLYFIVTPRSCSEAERADLVNSKGNPLVTNSTLEAVRKRLADRLSTVVADTSMITMSTAYASHFHDVYLDDKENDKMTGDHMKMLMPTLPLMVRDLIAPVVFVYCSRYIFISCLLKYIFWYILG